MMKSHALLDVEDNFRLCNNVFCAISDSHGGNADLSSQNEFERVVTLTWGSHGIIGNGGFTYLLEHRLNGDPQFQLFELAHRKIECHMAADAISEFLDLFPNRLPPLDSKEKFAIWDAALESIREELNRKYWREHDELTVRLASFIRANRVEFFHLPEMVYSDYP